MDFIESVNSGKVNLIFLDANKGLIPEAKFLNGLIDRPQSIVIAENSKPALQLFKLDVTHHYGENLQTET
ncbi:MAG: hypothetical protein AAF348_15585 [Bacteroidota bacterium]